MEKFPLNQKESGINRVVGFDSEKEESILQYFKDKFENNTISFGEKEKNPELQEMISRTNESFKVFLEDYGIEAVKIASENIHIIDLEQFTPEDLQRMKKHFGTDYGFHSSFKQGIGVFKDYDTSKLSFLQTLVHEMMHLQSFGSFQVSSKESAEMTLKKDNDIANFNIRRSGFSVGTLDGKRLLFEKIDESVITELQIRFEKQHMLDWPEIREDLEERDKNIKLFAEEKNSSTEDLNRNVATITIDSSGKYKLKSYPYYEDRRSFNSLLDDLYKKNTDDFASREDVFKLFAEASLKGSLLPVARLIEKTFGKGSFRRLGEVTADK